jgi:2-oxoglutarate ferredoxin oxidoreductase subunit beta
VRDPATGGVRIVDDPDAADVLVHDAHNPDPTTAFALSRLTDAGVLHRSPIGIFRNVDRPTYDDQARAQIATASEGLDDPRAALAGLIGGGDTWTVV